LNQEPVFIVFCCRGGGAILCRMSPLNSLGLSPPLWFYMCSSLIWGIRYRAYGMCTVSRFRDICPRGSLVQGSKSIGSRIRIRNSVSAPMCTSTMHCSVTVLSSIIFFVKDYFDRLEIYYICAACFRSNFFSIHLTVELFVQTSRPPPPWSLITRS
jgi:hypothetical protein